MVGTEIFKTYAMMNILNRPVLRGYNDIAGNFTSMLILCVIIMYYGMFIVY